MPEHFLEDNRVYYEHDASCTKKNLSPENEKGLRTCYECAGIFRSDGKVGVAVTDKRFDAWRE